MRYTSVISFVALGAALIALPACAQSNAAPAGQDKGKDRMAALDTNHDGFIDKTEAKGRLLEHFDEIDTNHDGKLSPDELKARIKARWQGMKGAGATTASPEEKPHMDHHEMGLAALDTDHDGKVSWAEFEAGMKAHFDKIDVNHDGVIDASEMPKHDHKKGDGHNKKDITPGTWGGTSSAGGASSASSSTGAKP